MWGPSSNGPRSRGSEVTDWAPPGTRDRTGGEHRIQDGDEGKDAQDPYDRGPLHGRPTKEK